MSKADAPAPQLDSPTDVTASAPLLHWQSLPGVTLRYLAKVESRQGKLGFDRAQTELTYEPLPNGRYQATWQLTPVDAGRAWRTQTSEGLIHPDWGLQPQRFSDHFKQRTWTTTLSRSDEGHEARFEHNTPAQPLRGDSQDRSSLWFQLAGWLQANPKLTQPGSVVTVHTVGPRDALEWSFHIHAPIRIQVPHGELAVIPVERAPVHPYDWRIKAWLAPSLGHLPARIQTTQASSPSIDQQLWQVETTQVTPHPPQP